MGGATWEQTFYGDVDYGARSIELLFYLLPGSSGLDNHSSLDAGFKIKGLSGVTALTTKAAPPRSLEQ